MYLISSCKMEERQTDFGASGTGVRQSQARLEKPGGTTRQSWGLRMSVSWIAHYNELSNDSVYLTMSMVR